VKSMSLTHIRRDNVATWCCSLSMAAPGPRTARSRSTATRQSLLTGLVVVLTACAGGASPAFASSPHGAAAHTPAARSDAAAKPVADPVAPPVPSGRKRFAAPASLGTWVGLDHPAPFPPGSELLLTDGSVLVSRGNSGEWWKLTPSASGSYTAGTWKQVASLPDGYKPLDFASAVLPDGRVIVEGGEYNGSSTPTWTNLGAIYDPLANTWTPVSPPTGWTAIGDAQSEVLANGQFMLADCCTASTALLNPGSLTWTATGSGKADRNDEEGWTLLPNDQLLTVDAHSPPLGSELYTPSTGQWTSGGSVLQTLVDSKPEIGPQALSPLSNTVLAVGATGRTSLYSVATSPGSWSVGPSLPSIGGLQYDSADGAAATLPNGQILVDASPGDYTPPTHFFLFDGTSFTQIADPANAPNESSTRGRMLVLPTGQVMYDDGIATQIYTPTGAPAAAWRPVIATVKTTLLPGSTNTLSGTQLAGLDQGAAYGDDFQDNTNYPLVRITNTATEAVSYARTTGMTSLSIAPGKSSSTKFTVGTGTAPGPSLLAVVANGIASAPVSVMVPVRVLDTGFSPTAAQTVIGGAMTWVLPASDTNSHTITDGSGLGLFNSGIRAPGGSFSFTFPAAGTYVVSDPTNRKSSTVGLRVSATPTSGTSATSFTIRWANRALPAGYVEDVSIERPGRSTFAPWRTGRTGTSASFLPDAGKGTYRFVSRIRKTANGHQSLFSPAGAITVQ
jgi:hypothetical protein